MRSWSSFLRCSLVAGTVGSHAGCVSTECNTATDCATGQLCQAERCVTPLPAGTAGGNLPASAPGGDDENSVLQQIRPSLPVAWMQRDPTERARIHFAQQQEVGGTLVQDEVLAFHAETGEVEQDVVLDLLGMFSGTCGLDVLHNGFHAGESFVSCSTAPALRIVYDEAYLGPTTDLAIGAALLRPVPATSSIDFSRVLLAERGGTLASMQLRNSDAFGQARFFDAIEPALSSVVALFGIDAAGIPGDHVLVHDRDRSELVPLTRNPLTERWFESSALPARALASSTHVVWAFGDIKATGFSSTPATPNYLTIEPRTGLVRYFNYEAGQEILPPTRFEANASLHAEAPAADERLVLDPSPSGDFLFYARRDGQRVYRIPLAPGADDLVRQAFIEEPGRSISAVIAVDDESVWISDSQQPLLEKIDLTESL